MRSVDSRKALRSTCGLPLPPWPRASSATTRTLSSDGRWIAYTSDKAGRQEVYVQPYPDLGGERLISNGGGSFPRWRRDGREVFYLANDRSLIAVPIDTQGGALSPGTPRRLFASNAMLGDHPAVAADMPYDVSSDGQRFLIDERVAPATEASAAQRSSLTVIVNWDKALRP